VFANPQPILNAKNTKFATCKTRVRPNTSDDGPRNRGPKPYARTKIESIIDCIKGSVTWRSRAITGRAGATIEEVIGEINVNIETVRVAAHFFFIVQFLGLSGSEGLAHVT
jgi:hypothetical protein